LLPFQLVDAAEYKLTSIVNRMELSQDYRPLLHIAWRQPAASSDLSQPVHVSTAPAQLAPDYGESLQPLAVPPVDLSTDLLLGAAQASPEAARTEEFVTGTINVSRNRYLHLDADLVFEPAPVKQAATSLFSIFKPEEPQVKGYRMQQSRRIRSGEVHYFDHPRFGLIALLTPIEGPSQDEPASGSTQEPGSGPN
jgi:hypothetical protein